MVSELLQQARPIQQLGLDPGLTQLLLSHNMLTALDVLCHSELDLMELLDLPLCDVQRLLLAVSAQVAPAYLTATQLYAVTMTQSYHVPTSLPGLDAALRRGIPAGAITELVGPAGVGKSQMSFGLALAAAMPRSAGGLGGTVVVIDTESKFSAARLQEIARSRCPGLSDDDIDAALTRVLVMTAGTVPMLEQMLAALPALVVQRGIVLVLVDSIAALLRSDMSERSQLLERQQLLGRQAAALKQLAERHKIPVVVTNQVTARPTGPASHAFQAPEQPQQGQGNGQLTAALGTKWAHAVNVRLVLERQGARRFLKVAKSPLCANMVFEYAITTAGMVQVGEGSELSPEQLTSAMDMSIANEWGGEDSMSYGYGGYD